MNGFYARKQNSKLLLKTPKLQYAHFKNVKKELYCNLNRLLNSNLDFQSGAFTPNTQIVICILQIYIHVMNICKIQICHSGARFSIKASSSRSEQVTIHQRLGIKDSAQRRTIRKSVSVNAGEKRMTAQWDWSLLIKLMAASNPNQEQDGRTTLGMPTFPITN